MAGTPGFPTAPGSVNPSDPPAEANKKVGIQTRSLGLKVLELVSPLLLISVCIVLGGKKYF